MLVRARPWKINSHRIELLFALGLLWSRFRRGHTGASVFLLLLGKRHAGLDDGIRVADEGEWVSVKEKEGLE